MIPLPDYIVKKILSNETVVTATRESLMVHYYKLSAVFVSFILAFFFWSTMVSWGLFGQILFLIWFLVNLIFAWRFLREYLGTLSILTLKRLVLIRATRWFNRSIRDIPLTEILDIEAQRHGVRQSLAAYGTVHVVIGNTPVPIPFVPHPERFAEDIRRMRAEAIRAEKRAEKMLGGEDATEMKKLTKQDLEKVMSRLARSADPQEFKEATESVLSASDNKEETE